MIASSLLGIAGFPPVARSLYPFSIVKRFHASRKIFSHHGSQLVFEVRALMTCVTVVELPGNLPEGVDDGRIEVLTAVQLKDIHGLLEGERFLVWTLRGQGVEGIRDREDARRDRDILSL